MHEESKGIGEAEGHHGIFIKTVPSSECGLRNIFLFNLELVVSCPSINFGEYLCPTELIKQIIDPRQWIFVFDGDIIHLTVIHTHAEAAILLIHEDSR